MYVELLSVVALSKLKSDESVQVDILSKHGELQILYTIAIKNYYNNYIYIIVIDEYKGMLEASKEENRNLEKATEQFKRMAYARDARIADLEREVQMMQAKKLAVHEGVQVDTLSDGELETHPFLPLKN